MERGERRSSGEKERSEFCRNELKSLYERDEKVMEGKSAGNENGWMHQNVNNAR